VLYYFPFYGTVVEITLKKVVMKIESLLVVSLTSIILMSSGNYQDSKIIAQGSNQFGIDYINQAKEGNYFISPLSISTAMAMTYAGAKEKTATEFENVMHFKNSNGNFHELNGANQKELDHNLNDVKWNLANRLWGYGPEPFQNQFLEINKKYYNAPIEFGASESKINTWVEKQTEGKIKAHLKAL